MTLRAAASGQMAGKMRPLQARSGPQANSLNRLSLVQEAVPCMYWGDRSPP